MGFLYSTSTITCTKRFPQRVGIRTVGQDHLKMPPTPWEKQTLCLCQIQSGELLSFRKASQMNNKSKSHSHLQAEFT